MARRKKLYNGIEGSGIIVKTLEQLSKITINRHGKNYSYLNSFYYNWFKVIDLNLLNSDSFTNQFLLMKEYEEAVFDQLEENILESTILAFQNNLSEQDSYVLLTAAWANGFAPEKSTAAAQSLDRYFTYYSDQKGSLIGINLFNEHFSEAMLQHFPKVRQKDLRLIYRLLMLKEAEDAEIQRELENVNEPTKERTLNLLALFKSLY